MAERDRPEERTTHILRLSDPQHVDDEAMVTVHVTAGPGPYPGNGFRSSTEYRLVLGPDGWVVTRETLQVIT